MRPIIFLLMLNLIAYPQYPGALEEDELDDPDDTQYLDQLLTTIFQPFSMETADSSSLLEHGYSTEAVMAILDWQGSGGNLQILQRKIHGGDLTLLKNDLKQGSQKTQIHLRQRMQYSPSLNGWRVLNKGHLHNRWGSVVLLSEQDPGERDLTDHSIVALSSQSIPWLDHLVIGDFHVSWGGGLILNQQGSRLSLNPGSLLRSKQSTIRPHYSSREVDYFHGIASSFSFGEAQGSAFISSRLVAGTMHGDQFTEDGDGIHPTGRILEYRRTNDLGFALETVASGMLIYGSTLYSPHASKHLAYELGLSTELGGSQKIQIYSNSLDLSNHRILGAWAYHSPALKVSLQLRHFTSDQIHSPGAIPTLMGAAASNEKGLSVRAQLRPTNKVQIRYAIDTGFSIDFHSSQDYRAIQQHKLQVNWKMAAGVFQVDFSQKNDRHNVVADNWAGELSNRRLTKVALSTTHLFLPRLRYGINVKSAFAQKESSFLVQQRLFWVKGNWTWAMGYVRFFIPDYTMRLSVYETSVAESFGFYTAFDDGDRWFVYLKQQVVNWFLLELKLVQTRSFEIPILPEQLALSLQMSIVL
ncbi:MAG: hypothetical protein HQ506_12930 [Candidatus Marinimicrobia bacterium]|nr:hypothetical protein [Candidatus Neomarinimicrobiota bacterium]